MPLLRLLKALQNTLRHIARHAPSSRTRDSRFRRTFTLITTQLLARLLPALNEFPRRRLRPPLSPNSLVHAHSRRDHLAHIAHIPGHNNGCALLGQATESVDVLLRDAQAERSLRALAALLDRVCDGVDAARRRAGFQLDGFGFTGGGVDLFRFERLRRQNDALLAALGDVDRALPLSFTLEDLGALAALGGHLAVHGLDDGRGRVDVADLVAQAAHAPVGGGFVDGLGDVGVERGALLQHVVEGQLANFGAHGGLRELGDGVVGVLDAVGGLEGVEDAGVQHAVEFEGDVVGGDGALGGDFHGVFFERLDVGDAVDDGDEDGEAGLEHAAEASHALDDPGRLLRDELDDGVGGEAGALEVSVGRAGGVGCRAEDAVSQAGGGAIVLRGEGALLVLEEGVAGVLEGGD